MTRRLMHLTDWTLGVTRFWDLDENKVVDFAPQGVVPKIEGASAHLRGMEILVEGKKPPTFTETGAFVERTPELTQVLTDHHHNRNGWWFDWPHHKTDTEGELPQEEARLVLQRQLDAYPHGFENVQVTAVDRRLAWYFSDGSYQSQYWFDRLVPPPNKNPFTKNGNIRLGYTRGPTLDQVRHFRGELPDYTGTKISSNALEAFGRRPLLYHGPAWACRVTIDGQDILFDMNRMFCQLVQKDDVWRFDFIGTDWCQRDGVERYSKGIDLQKGLYTPETWLFTVCTKRAQDSRRFVPKGVVTKTVQVRQLKAAGVKEVKVLSHEEAMAKHTSQVRVLYEKGLPFEEIVDTLRDRLLQMSKCPAAKAGSKEMIEVAKLLHKVPVRLPELQPTGDDAGKPFKAETRALYADATVDGQTYHAPHLTVRGYKGNTDGVGQVRPLFLEIDVERVKAMMPVSTAATAVSGPELPPLEAGTLDEITQMVLEQVKIKGYPVSKWTPEMEERTETGEAASATPSELQEAIADLKPASTQCTGQCESCELVAKDGKAVGDCICFHPGDSECIFRQHKIAVPPEARDMSEAEGWEYDATVSGVEEQVEF